MEPYIMYIYKDFMIGYKPPYYIMDTSNQKYSKLNNYIIKKLLKNTIKPYHVWVITGHI